MGVERESIRFESSPSGILRLADYYSLGFFIAAAGFALASSNELLGPHSTFFFVGIAAIISIGASPSLALGLGSRITIREGSVRLTRGYIERENIYRLLHTLARSSRHPRNTLRLPQTWGLRILQRLGKGWWPHPSYRLIEQVSVGTLRRIDIVHTRDGRKSYVTFLTASGKAYTLFDPDGMEDLKQWAENEAMPEGVVCVERCSSFVYPDPRIMLVTGLGLVAALVVTCRILLPGVL